MFIRAHEAGYMCVAALSEKDLPVLALGRCPYKLFSIILNFHIHVYIILK